MSCAIRWKAAFSICTFAIAASSAWAQTPIFVDDFENGVDDASLATGGRWAAVGGGASAPTYQTENNPFPTGSLYVRMFDPDTTAGPRFLTSDTAGSDNREPFIANQVTTFSFDFVEPDTLTGIVNGISFGYTSADDLNTAERVWRGFLANGALQPDQGNEGGAVAYGRGVVHTVFMIGNDTANPLVNYAGGHTLDAGEADVWISIGGAEPTFAFAVGRQNPAAAPQGIGFRSFTVDIGEVLVDNVLLMPGATFDRGGFAMAPPSLTLRIDPANGQARIENNTTGDMTFSGYEITSEQGSLFPVGWKSIAAPPTIAGFPAGSGIGDGWEPISSTSKKLTEVFLTGESTIPAGGSVSIGHAFNTTVGVQDVMVTFLGGNVPSQTEPAEYGALPAVPLSGDFDENGPVNGADLVTWRNGFGTATGAVHTQGDANGDGDVDGSDFLVWQRQFGLTASSTAAGTSVPEPGGSWLAGAGIVGWRAATRRRTSRGC